MSPTALTIWRSPTAAATRRPRLLKLGVRRSIGAGAFKIQSSATTSHTPPIFRYTANQTSKAWGAPAFAGVKTNMSPSLLALAAGRSIAALRLAGDWLGLTRRATEGVQLALTTPAAVAPTAEPEREPTQEELLAALQNPETQRTRHILYRYLPFDLEYLQRERAAVDEAIRRREAGGLQPVLPDVGHPDDDAEAAADDTAPPDANTAP